MIQFVTFKTMDAEILRVNPNLVEAVVETSRNDIVEISLASGRRFLVQQDPTRSVHDWLTGQVWPFRSQAPDVGQRG